jgi:hypothetical protein
MRNIFRNLPGGTIVNKIQRVLAGSMVAGALAAGVLAAPAAQASTDSASAPIKHFFSNTYSSYNTGQGEDKFDRSYFGKGYWYFSKGRYYFFGDLFDRDHDKQYTYVWFHYRYKGKDFFKTYKTFGHKHFHKFGGFQKSKGFKDFDIRVCEGGLSVDCGKWHDVF